MTAGPRTLAELSARSGIGFGTSGLRGRVADLSDEVCAGFVHGFLSLLGGRRGSLLIGQDLRPSSPRIAGTCAAQARAMGFDPVNAGVVPTPALAFAAQSRGIPAIMVTGSHIPFDRNGIKFYWPHGEISKDDEARILAAPCPALPPPESAVPALDPGVAEFYVSRYTEALGARSLAGLTLGIYEHSSAARDMLHEVLRALGARTVAFGRSDGFVPVDTEAVREEDRAMARAWAGRERLDAILTTDGDADRPLIADEKGTWIRGDILGILCARALGARTVVTPVSSNTALEATGWFPKIIRTRIGSPYVIAAMAGASNVPVVGYEANGGFLLGSDVMLEGRSLAALPTRDAVLPMILVLAMSRAGKCTLSDLVTQLPSRHTASDRLQEVDVARCRALLAGLAADPSGFSALGRAKLPGVAALDLTDGVRASFESGDILHLRLSGNAPELRCYAESSHPERAAELCSGCLETVAGLLLKP